MVTPASVIGDLPGMRGMAASGQRLAFPGRWPSRSWSTANDTGQWVTRRRGGIESLRVSTPHELKSFPSTSPTHPGPPAQKGGGAGSARSWAPAGQLALYRKSRARGGGCADASMDASQLRLSFSRGARGSCPLAARKNGLLRELNPGPLAPLKRESCH